MVLKRLLLVLLFLLTSAFVPRVSDTVAIYPTLFETIQKLIHILKDTQIYFILNLILALEGMYALFGHINKPHITLRSIVSSFPEISIFTYGANSLSQLGHARFACHIHETRKNVISFLPTFLSVASRETVNINRQQ